MISQWLYTGGKALFELFFPRKCVTCNRRLTIEEHLCIHCLTHLPCTYYHHKAQNKLMMRFWGEANVERATAYFFYSKESPYHHILYQLKYKGNFELARYMGVCMATHIGKESSFWEGIDYIIPVPLSIKRLKKRGYNQCEMIAQGLSEETGIPIETSILFRIKDNPTQTKQTIQGRWSNSQDIFAINEENIGKIKGKHILLLDDVITTGSTIISCIRTIHNTEPNCLISIISLALTSDG